jgi:hypothetical protein
MFRKRLSDEMTTGHSALEVHHVRQERIPTLGLCQRIGENATLGEARRKERALPPS